MISIEKKIDLIRAFMQVEGNLEINSICHNYEKEGGVAFSTYIKMDRETRHINMVMDKTQVDLLVECNTIDEIYKCYEEMEYFKEY